MTNPKEQIDNISFLQKSHYEIGEIVIGTCLTTCMKCVAFDADGAPLFRQIHDPKELASPGTGVIWHELIEHAKHNGRKGYDIHYCYQGNLWIKEDPAKCNLTLQQAKMLTHNLRNANIPAKIYDLLEENYIPF